jgi:methionyl-tRNA formyltransferase
MASASGPLRTVFFGTPAFAAPALETLIASPVTEVLAVVCQPDRPAGRGRKLTPPATKAVAEEHGIPVWQPEKLRGTDFAERLAELRPDIGVIAAYGKILPPDVLAVPRHGFLNIHASLLPRHRGAAPIQWALILGDRETGVTIMQVEEGCDTGPIIAQERCEILEDDDARSLSDMLSMVGASLMLSTLERLAHEGRLEGRPQDEAQATRAPLLKKEDGILDWSQPAATIFNRVRGLTPWPGAQTLADTLPLKILQAEPIPAHHPSAQPGEVVESDARRGFVVATGSGFLLIQRVQPAGKAPMSGADAVKGGWVRAGMILRAPARD